MVCKQVLYFEMFVFQCDLFGCQFVSRLGFGIDAMCQKYFHHILVSFLAGLSQINE